MVLVIILFENGVNLNYCLLEKQILNNIMMKNGLKFNSFIPYHCHSLHCDVK